MTLKHLLISIVIPVYKVEAYLPRCLDSILCQTYSELEILCVNDGSPDGCLSILEEYAGKDSRIKVIDQENQGVAAAWNHGMELASGELVAFIDSDDWIHPRYFEILADSLMRHHADAVFCEGVKVFDDEDPDPSLKGASARKISLAEAFSLWTVRHCVWARLYRRELLRGHTFSREIKIGDDTMFNLDVLCHWKDPKLFYIPEELYYWFTRRDSITHKWASGGVIGEAEWYARHMDPEELTGSEWLLLEQAVKAALSARYGEMYSRNAEKYKKEANELLGEFIPRVWKSRYVPFRKKLLLDVMARFPWLYRVFRLVEDPTMLRWEREKRRERDGAL